MNTSLFVGNCSRPRLRGGGSSDDGEDLAEASEPDLGELQRPVQHPVRDPGPRDPRRGERPPGRAELLANPPLGREFSPVRSKLRTGWLILRHFD